VNLNDVRLESLHFDLESPGVPPPYSLADSDVNLSWHRDEEQALVVYRVAMNLKAVGAGEDQAGDEQVVFTANIANVILWDLPPELEASDEDLEAFGRVTAVFTVYPYIREEIQSVTARAGLPPLTLNVLRSPIEPVATPTDPTG
jgi:preprotein translocase subunit SecB